MRNKFVLALFAALVVAMLAPPGAHASQADPIIEIAAVCTDADGAPVYILDELSSSTIEAQAPTGRGNCDDPAYIVLFGDCCVCLAQGETCPAPCASCVDGQCGTVVQPNARSSPHGHGAPFSPLAPTIAPAAPTHLRGTDSST